MDFLLRALNALLFTQVRRESQASGRPYCSGSRLPFDAPLRAMGHSSVSQIQDVLGLGKRQWDEKKSSYWQRLLQTQRSLPKYQGTDLCLYISK